MAARVDAVKIFLRGFFAVLAVFYGALLLGLALGLMFVYSSAKAAGATPVPAECVELARREGFPTDTMTRTQAARAGLRLARLSDRDPLVRACRAAVKATGGSP